MNILIITRLYPEFAGQSRLEATYAVHDFAKEWAQCHQVYVMRVFGYYPLSKYFSKIGLGKKSTLYSEEKSFCLDGVTIFRILVNRLHRVRYSRYFLKAASKKIEKEIESHFIPDLIVCHILKPNIFIGNMLKNKFACKLVWCLHETDLRILKSKKDAKALYEVEYNIDKIAQRSYKIQKEFLSHYQGEKSKEDFFIAMSGIDTEQIISLEKLNTKVTHPVKQFISVANLIERKNVDVVIRAFSRINEAQKYDLVIVGDGPERVNLEKLIVDLNCQGSVHLVGLKSKEEVLVLMENSDVFVMVSSHETLGLVYLEAMAKGCLVIGSKGEGIDGTIIDNENGFLCESGSVEALAKVLTHVTEIDTIEKKRLTNSAVNTAKSLSQEEVADKYLNWMMA